MPPHNVAVTLAYTTDSEGWNIEKEQNEGPRTLWETQSPLKYGWQWNTFCLYMCQVWLWSTKWGRAKPDRVLPRERTSHSKHPLPTTQETTLHMDITRWSMMKTNWLYSLQLNMEKLCTVNKKQDRELTVAQIMSSLLQNWGLNWRKYEKPLDHSGIT